MAVIDYFTGKILGLKFNIEKSDATNPDHTHDADHIVISIPEGVEANLDEPNALNTNQTAGTLWDILREIWNRIATIRKILELKADINHNHTVQNIDGLEEAVIEIYEHIDRTRQQFNEELTNLPVKILNNSVVFNDINPALSSLNLGGEVIYSCDGDSSTVHSFYTTIDVIGLGQQSASNRWDVDVSRGRYVEVSFMKYSDKIIAVVSQEIKK